MTDASHAPCWGTGKCRLRIIAPFSDLSVARIRTLMVRRINRKWPFLDVPQICVNPRNVNVSGFPSPRLAYILAAKIRLNRGFKSIAKLQTVSQEWLAKESLTR